jgi:hypothetical protein
MILRGNDLRRRKAECTSSNGTYLAYSWRNSAVAWPQVNTIWDLDFLENSAFASWPRARKSDTNPFPRYSNLRWLTSPLKRYLKEELVPLWMEVKAQLVIFYELFRSSDLKESATRHVPPRKMGRAVMHQEYRLAKHLHKIDPPMNSVQPFSIN